MVTSTAERRAETLQTFNQMLGCGYAEFHMLGLSMLNYGIHSVKTMEKCLHVFYDGDLKNPVSVPITLDQSARLKEILGNEWILGLDNLAKISQEILAQELHRNEVAIALTRECCLTLNPILAEFLASRQKTKKTIQ